MSENLPTCPLCGQRVDSLFDQLEKKLEAGVKARILREHPRWVTSEGSCAACLNYFRNLKERPKVKDLLRHKVGEAHHASRGGRR